LFLREYKKRVKRGCVVKFKMWLVFNVGFELVDIKFDKVFSILQKGGRKNG